MNVEQSQTAYKNIFAAVTARQAAQPSRDNEITLKHLASGEVAIKKALMRFSLDCIDAYCKMQNPLNKGENFIAVKANVKIVNMLYAIGVRMLSKVDEYSVTIIANAFHNDGTMLAKSALVCLSNGIEYTEQDTAQVIKYRMRKAESTASTQRSSTREMLRVLQLADIQKAHKGDSIPLNEKGKKILAPLFADAVAAAALAAQEENEQEEQESVAE
jgi:hypothetical protein